MIQRRIQLKADASNPLVLRPEAIAAMALPPKTRILFIYSVLLASMRGNFKAKALAASLAANEFGDLGLGRGRLLSQACETVKFEDDLTINLTIHVPTGLTALASLGAICPQNEEIGLGCGRWIVVEYSSFWEPKSEFLAKRRRGGLASMSFGSGERWKGSVSAIFGTAEWWKALGNEARMDDLGGDAPAPW